MNCDCVCNKILPYCFVGSCGTIDLKIVAQNDGVHTLKTSFLGAEVIVKKKFLATEQIVFPVDALNEDYVYTAQLFDPDDEQVLIVKDDIQYDCFQFQTRVSVDVTKPADIA